MHVLNFLYAGKMAGSVAAHRLEAALTPKSNRASRTEAVTFTSESKTFAHLVHHAGAMDGCQVKSRNKIKSQLRLALLARNQYWHNSNQDFDGDSYVQ